MNDAYPHGVSSSGLVTEEKSIFRLDQSSDGIPWCESAESL